MWLLSVISASCELQWDYLETLLFKNSRIFLRTHYSLPFWVYFELDSVSINFFLPDPEFFLKLCRIFLSKSPLLYSNYLVRCVLSLDLGRCDHCHFCVIINILSIGNELLSEIRSKTQKDSVKSKSLLNLKIRYKPSEILFRRSFSCHVFLAIFSRCKLVSDSIEVIS